MSRLQEIIEKFELFEMAASLRKDDTGVDNIIWVSTKQEGGSHNIRLKIQFTDTPKIKRNEWATVTFDSDGENIKFKHGDISSIVKKQVIKFIKDNVKTLVKYWDEEITTTELIKSLKKVEG